jgi:hypothetical protein
VRFGAAMGHILTVNGNASRRLKMIKTYTPWQIIFALSKANGGEYRGEELPEFHGWQWPTGTYLQRRLEKLKQEAE